METGQERDRRSVRAERRVVTATRTVEGSTAALFAVLADPRRHVDFDGSQTLRGAPLGPARLYMGAEFTMAMQQSRWTYRSTSTVVEFVEGRLITWVSAGVWRGHRLVGGQRWAWRLEQSGAATVVRHSYIWGYARLPIMTVWLPGYPRRAQAVLPRSIELLEIAARDTCPRGTREHHV